MKNPFAKRILSVFCAFLVLVPYFTVSTSAADLDSIIYDRDSVVSWESALSSPGADVVEAIANYFGVENSLEKVFWRTLDGALGQNVGSVEEQKLYALADAMNSVFHGNTGNAFGDALAMFPAMKNRLCYEIFGLASPYFEVVTAPSGLKRIKDSRNGLYLVRSDGAYPYVELSSDGTTTAGNHWVGERSCSTAQVNLQDYATLSAINASLIEKGISSKLYRLGNYYGIWYNYQYYCDSQNRPIVCWADEYTTATSQDRPGTSVKDENGETATDEDGNPLDGSTVDVTASMDLNNMTIVLPGGQQLVADQVIYDESTKTYHIDSHDTYNYTYNYYYTWNYYINYTSITYIGQTEEYNKYYEVYYELPDGRDSADLTAEELEQLNLSIDVIPYARSADDVSIRSLYHFDGDTKDSSYWNYCTEFYWHTGASLTYMDAGTFEGALYLDETEHEFELLLPSAITSGDFTMQFRYYQSATAAPVTDSYVQLSGTDVLKFDGASLKNGSGAALASMPVGSWNEIAISRYNGSIRYYLNGVYLSSTSNTTAFGDTILFHFGDEQQTFKYFDEFRFVSKSLYGAYNYTPSSVPFDTNLTLVLPDSQIPVADEYWSITASSDNLLNGNFTNGTLPGGFTTLTSSTNTYSVIPPALGIRTTYSSISCSSTCATLTRLSNSTTYSTSTAEYWVGGMFSCIGRCNNSYTYLSGLENGTYTLSVILGDGTVSSYTFTLKYGSSSGVKSGSQTFDWGTLGVERCSIGSTSSALYAYILPNSGTSIDVVYVELLKASSTDLSAEWVESVTVFDKDSLNTPTLAVRTDLDITSYQIGGVRPSLPSKGQVWALVEGQYITSLQIYTGSAWEGVDGRIWTGERWIPYSSYNIVTLKDMYDIVDGSGSNYEYIYTESGFWSWWQKSWNAFTEKLFSALGTGGSSSGTTGSAETESLWSKLKDAVTTGIADLIEGLFTLLTEVLQKLIGAATDLLTGIFSFLTDTVLGGVTDFFTSLTDGSLLDGFQQSTTDAEGNVTVTTGLPEGVSAVFAFFSGLFLLMPPELRYAAFFGIGLMLFLAVLKLVKE